MDLGPIAEAFALLRTALGAAKDVKDLLPSPQREAVEQTLEKADVASRAAEAELARELGHRLCHCTWPPQIMLRTTTGRMMGGGTTAHRPETWKCPACPNEEHIIGSAFRSG